MSTVKYHYAARPNPPKPQQTHCPTCGSGSYMLLRIHESPSLVGLDRRYCRCKKCGEEYVAMTPKPKREYDDRGQ